MIGIDHLALTVSDMTGGAFTAAPFKMEPITFRRGAPALHFGNQKINRSC